MFLVSERDKEVFFMILFYISRSDQLRVLTLRLIYIIVK